MPGTVGLKTRFLLLVSRTDERTLSNQHFAHRRITMIRSLLLALSLLLFSACEQTNLLVMTDAASDAVSAMTLTDKEVQKLARLTLREADAKHQVAAAGNSYATRLQSIVAKLGERDGRTFNFKVYLTREINAFAMADGSIRVFSGLMDLMNDRELLFVIGHEMGHVVQDHSRKKVVLAYAASAVKKGLAAQENEIGQIANSLVGSLVEQLTNAQFSQHEERQADRYAAVFLRAEGLDNAAAVSALMKLSDLARQHSFLSSHPDPEARAKRLLNNDLGDDAEEQSFFAKLLAYAEKLVIGTLNLILLLLEWALSFFK